MFRAGKRFGAADCAIAVPGSRRGVLRCALHTSLSFWQCWQSHPSATPNRTMDLLAAWWAQKALARRRPSLGSPYGSPTQAGPVTGSSGTIAPGQVGWRWVVVDGVPQNVRVTPRADGIGSAFINGQRVLVDLKTNRVLQQGNGPVGGSVGGSAGGPVGGLVGGPVGGSAGGPVGGSAGGPVG